VLREALSLEVVVESLLQVRVHEGEGGEAQ
jgi:hypothetical protein